MKNNYLISINNLTDIDKYKKVGGSAFLFALDSYTIGYNTFTIEEINSIQNETKKIKNYISYTHSYYSKRDRAHDRNNTCYSFNYFQF